MEFLKTNFKEIILAIGGVIAFFVGRRQSKASLVKIEEENTDAIITRYSNDNKTLIAENVRLREDNKQLCDEKEALMVEQETLLEELHDLKIKIAELTNQIIRLEAKFKINSK